MLLAAALLAIASSGTAGTQAQLTAASLEPTGTGLILSLDLSAVRPAHSFVLGDPARIVLDIEHVDLARGFRPPGPLGTVAGLRVAARGNGVRVVLNVEQLPHSRLEQRSAGRGMQWRLYLSPAGDVSPAAERAADTAPATHAPQGSGRDLIIAVDAGHGGTDPGASGPGRTHEKDITLAIARRLARHINAESGMHAVLTRDADVFVPLRERMQRARGARADLMISIHADAVRDRTVDGASVYILSERGASSEAARWLAERENAADLRGGVSLADQQRDLASVLLNLSQSATIGSSVEAADRVLAALDDVGAIRRHEVQQAGFLVLKAPDMPSMLIETAYISNPSEERKLRSPDYQERLASAICNGARNYFREHPPDGTQFALQRAARFDASLRLSRKSRQLVAASL